MSKPQQIISSLLLCLFASMVLRYSIAFMQRQSLSSAWKTKSMSVRMQATCSTNNMNPVRVRFAPSPTGSLHIGGARTALFNWLLAKKTNGKFLVRVEDTDQARSTKESEAAILNDLRWLNLDWDEGPEVGGPYGPYRQSERKEIYNKAVEKLISEGKAYRCFAKEEELIEETTQVEEGEGSTPIRAGRVFSEWRNAKPEEIQAKLEEGAAHCVRFKVPSGKTISILDKVRGVVTWETDAALLKDFVIMRSDGMPVYNFCVSVDDADMKITHVIRAEEHLPNTLKQMLILEALQVKPPIYAHCSLILGSDRSKLSKRHGATSVNQFSQQGFVPEAMVNYLANLGWNDGTDKEIYTPQELYEAFSLDRIIKSAAVFDMEKLRWINAQHLRLRSPEQMKPVVLYELCTGDIPILSSRFLPVTDAATSSSSTITTTTAPTSTTINDNTTITTPEQQQFDKFMQLATAIAQRDMEVTVDSRRLVASCLEFPLNHTLYHDIHVEDIVLNNKESFILVHKTLIDDYKNNKMPQGVEENFSVLWKNYIKDLSKRLGLKGKGLFHPIRLCLTGRVSGPDVGDQIQLMQSAIGLLNPEYAKGSYIPLLQRMEMLEGMNIEEEVIKIVQEAKKQRESVVVVEGDTDATTTADIVK